jgi:hypothetical protein
MIKNDECNDNQNDKKMKKTILTWPSLWLQVFHTDKNYKVIFVCPTKKYYKNLKGKH